MKKFDDWVVPIGVTLIFCILFFTALLVAYEIGYKHGEVDCAITKVELEETLTKTKVITNKAYAYYLDNQETVSNCMEIIGQEMERVRLMKEEVQR